jgi:uncharacterized membrane protein YcaP (DUF421 family)
MDLDWIWKAVLIIFIGSLLLRISGRRSISQMTVSQTIIMISIGTLLIQPVSGKNVWVTFGTASLLIITLLFLEFIQVKSNMLEKLLTGVAVPVIEDGQLNIKNLKKLKMSVDKLEMRLRQASITNINDVHQATIEPSGQLGYVLKTNKQPATKEDIQNLTDLVHSYFSALDPQLTNSNLTAPPKKELQNLKQETTNLFTEVFQKENKPKPPNNLE